MCNFPTDANNFRQKRLYVLRIALWLPKFPKIGILGITFAYLTKKIWTISDSPKFRVGGGSWLFCPNLPSYDAAEIAYLLSEYWPYRAVCRIGSDCHTVVCVWQREYVMSGRPPTGQMDARKLGGRTPVPASLSELSNHVDLSAALHLICHFTYCIRALIQITTSPHCP